MLIPTSGLQMRSLIKANGELEISLVDAPTPTPGPLEVVVRVEATPLNPSDIGLLFGAADIQTRVLSGTSTHPLVTMKIPERAMKSMQGRLDQSLPVGNEGAGTVIAAGTSPAAQALLGKTVAMIGGGMYAQYRCLEAANCIALAPDATAADGASSFVNPLTALGMVETMRREGHKALVHTAAASNLGQMLNRICQKDHIELVNIVRQPEQAALLRSMGARYVCDTSVSTFMEDLTQALMDTGASIAFDATGGGQLAGQILTCMETALNRTATVYSRYGSTTHKQVYIYGGLDVRPTEITRNFGFAWGIGGWLLFPFLNRIGQDDAQKLRDRVSAELKTTFASHYSNRITLAQALQPDVIAAYTQRATGSKYLITPHQA
ncbi:zinc-binding dehydrogenase [Limnohabitans sp. Rim8]|uniref:zinc-binding dehydrogenase n=1 Tax=Limnohabitans sp. Rim8 TaxID=1100718 RepID=UPI00261F3C8A|nr:zinc-binding dehydrogenase [Limnohabitans sp. Rim8]